MPKFTVDCCWYSLECKGCMQGLPVHLVKINIDYCSQKTINGLKISVHQNSWEYEEDPWKGPEPRLVTGR
jgi:hypothetical protein